MGSENSQTNLKLAEHHRTPKNQAAEICEEIVSSCYEASSVRPTSLKKSATLRCSAHSWTKYQIPAKNQIKTFVKLTHHANVCHDLTKTMCEAHNTCTKAEYTTVRADTIHKMQKS